MPASKCPALPCAAIRCLSQGRQTLLTLAHLRNGNRHARLAAGLGVNQSHAKIQTLTRCQVPLRARR
ncbi:transposase family protein [Streptomyces sp. NPDC017260]|uniref:transposase family protein n=1 Tax=unclassified Streptomyces TaxID=2593676 RepID=UPI00379315A4